MTETKQAADLIHAKPERRLPALAVSRGIGIGRISFFDGERRRFFRLNLNPEQIGSELKKFRTALDKSILQLRELSTHKIGNGGQPVSGIFGVHLLMLESPLVEKIVNVISTQRVNADWAIRTVLDEYAEKQVAVPDSQFKDKYLDIEDVASRLLGALNNDQTTAEADLEAVIVARELTPSQMMELVKARPAAIVTEHGGWTSHSSILAREFSVPMVSGVRDLGHLASAGDCIVVNGITGEVILNPSDARIAEFSSPQSDTKSAVPARANVGKIKTLDGTLIIIRANVDQPEAYAAAEQCGAQGIGLFRSESLLLGSGVFPTEDEQFAAYQKIADASGTSGVNIRTFDIDSREAGVGSVRVESNPSLGLRSIRLSLAEPQQFRTQIRALLRASFRRTIGIILPMVSGVSEILRSREIIRQESIALTGEGVDIGDPKIGAMIEVPSAVFAIDKIVKNVDFLCLGTNDLVQYLLAVDRDNDSVADWYQTLHPAVISALHQVVSAAKKADIPLAVCGEMAGSPFYVPVLLGLGARELSMNVNSIEPVRRLLSGISLSDSIRLIERIKTFDTAEDIEAFLTDHYVNNWSGLFASGLLDVRHR